MPFESPENMNEFKALVVASGKNNKKCLVQVSTTWCGPCEGIKDDMAQMSTDFAEQYTFIYIDCDKCE